MASATRTRDWANYDYYEVLGVSPNADAARVTRAYRELVKQSHPDIAGDDRASERFADITAAYAVLGDRTLRRRYDEVRAQSGGGPERAILAPIRPKPTPKVHKPWSARRSAVVLTIGVLVTLLGCGAAWLTWSMHEHDARQRARFVPVEAIRHDDAGGAQVTFLTQRGLSVTAPLPRQHGDPNGLDRTVRVRYDPADPADVIRDRGTFGRDITFAIVAMKLLVGGLVLAGFGAKRLRAAR